MKVFVTGATGFVGGYVLRELKARGHTPIILVRPGSEKKLESLQGVKLVFGDVDQPEQFEGELGNADAVIHLVGVIREFPSRGITFRRLHAHASANMVNAALKAGVKRFIHMSANGADPNGVSQYQTTKWLAETTLKSSGLNWTIFRPSVIFGDSKGQPEFTGQLADVIRKFPVTPIFGDGNYPLDPVAVEDVARCMVMALSMDKTAGKIYCMGGGNPVPFRQVIQIVGKGLGRPRTRTIGVPLWIIRPLATLMGGFEFFPVTADQISMLIQGNVCAKLDYMEDFGVSPIPFTYKNLAYLRRS